MKVLDLWCGTKSATKAFEDGGYEVVSVDIDPKWNATITDDIMNVSVEQLSALGPFQFGWASVECKVYSIANLHSRHWKKDQRTGLAQPLTERAREMNRRVQHTISLLEALCPLWVLENPVGMLRKQPFMAKLQNHSITYCQYGESRMKPTDLWGQFPRGFLPRPKCKAGASCHDTSTRGSREGGTMAQKYEDRIKVPYQLSQDLFQSCEMSGFKPIVTLEDF
jgi:hypothetical protein